METTPVVGNAFTTSCSNWKEGTYENFKDWALKQFDVRDSDSDDEVEIPVQMMKAKDIRFEQKETGEFILPPMSNYKTVKQKQRVVRGYIGAVYRQSVNFIFITSFLTISIGDFTENSRSAFPFGLASKNDQVIYSLDSAPKGFCLSDPDHYSAFKIDSLYTHWLGRQNNGLQPFVIVNSSPQHEKLLKKSKSRKGKGKAKVDYVDVNDDDEEEEENDEEREVEGGKKSKGRKVREQENDDDDQEKDMEEKMDMREEVNSDVDEDVSPPTKFGPPIGMKKQFHHFPVAGPSTLPLQQHAFGIKHKNDSKPSKFSTNKILKTSLKPPKTPKFLNFQQKMKEKINAKKMKSRNLDTTKGLTTSKMLKKRRSEEDVAIGPSSKLSKTDPSKKSGRLNEREHVDVPTEESSKTSGEMKIEKKRKHLDEEELNAESSGMAKRFKSDSSKYVLFCQYFFTLNIVVI